MEVIWRSKIPSNNYAGSVNIRQYLRQVKEIQDSVE